MKSVARCTLDRETAQALLDEAHQTCVWRIADSWEISNSPHTGITADKMAACRWLKPRIVVTIDFLEWTLDNRLRHAAFGALSTGTPAKNISREG